MNPDRFSSFVAIDWSGANVARPPGLAIARADAGTAPPVLIEREGGWSRAEILDWLAGLARSGEPVLVGLDLSPSLPFADRGAFFPGWERSPPDARGLWRLVEELSGDDPHLAAAGFLADPETARHFRQTGACGDLFPGGAGRYRVCEGGQREMGLSPYSCFNLVGAAQVGKSSLTGMRVLHRLAGRVPIWPFEPVPASGPLIVEIYTTIAARAAGIGRGRSKMRDGESLDAALAGLGVGPHQPLARYDDHATDAMLSAAWLRQAVSDQALWQPAGLTAELAATEGWTFGVP